MSDSKEYSVYCITNTVNGKRYIGQSNSPFSRFRTHLNALRREADGTANFHKQHKQDFIDDFSKYGVSAFSFSILEEHIETEGESLEKETIAIEAYQTIEHGYNAKKKAEKGARKAVYRRYAEIRGDGSMDWRSEIFGLLHYHKITQIELAEQLGVTSIYVCQVLAGRENPAGMEKRMRDAIDAIAEKRGQ